MRSARSSRLAASAAVLLPVAALALGRRRFDAAAAERVDALRANADAPGEPIDRDDVDALPAPVRRYLEAAIADGRSRVSSARLAQRGSFRLGGRDSPWKPLRATQHYTTDPPGFVWDATVALAPLVPVRVVDAYVDGRGSLRAAALSAIPVASATPGPELNEGELLRYLAEAVWFPTALVDDAVDWTGIDERSARATVTDGETSASLVFHFDESGLVERVRSDGRYRQETGTTVPWEGAFADYRWRDGLRVPTRASVQWDLPDGPLPYWWARVTDVTYDAR